MRRRWTVLVAAGLVAAFAAGCSASDDRGSTPTRAADADPPAVDTDEPGTTVDPETGTVERAIIYSGTLQLLDDDPFAVADEAIALAENIGGFVALDDRSGKGSTARASVTLRIPAESFTETVEDLADLAEESSRKISAEDATTATIDIDAAIESKQASLERVRNLMDKASNLNDIIALEDELTAREAELATLEAAKRALSEAVGYSTLTLRIGSTASPERTDDNPDGFIEGLAAGWDAFLMAGRGLLTIIGILLPFLIALAIPGGALWWWLRQRRRGSTVPGTTPPPDADDSAPPPPRPF